MTTRRHFMSQTAAAASVMSFPLIAGAQPKPVKVGVLHPVTGALAYSGPVSYTHLTLPTNREV